MPTKLELLAMKVYCDDASINDPAEKLRELLRDAIAAKLLALVAADAPASQRSNAQRVVGQDESPATKSRALRSP